MNVGFRRGWLRSLMTIEYRWEGHEYVKEKNVDFPFRGVIEVSETTTIEIRFKVRPFYEILGLKQ